MWLGALLPTMYIIKITFHPKNCSSEGLLTLPDVLLGFATWFTLYSVLKIMQFDETDEDTQ